MADIPDNNRETDARAVKPAELRAWFIHEVLPMEAALTQYLHHNWRNPNDVEDLLQDVYVRVCEAALRQRPDSVKSFVFATARNLLIDRVRREHVIPIEAVLDLDSLGIAVDEPGPDRNVMAREELQRLQSALDRLPPRCREVVVLRRIEGMQRRAIALRMGITEATVAEHLANGVSALADILYGEPADFRRKP
ncbi:MAG TPA: sigma-70 family RNA polymerase sigma factor [Rhizomicrobium sp.]|jgi:RNA polymerase sigma factor (sigma-70 family)|nr:sigma-70 family RNA polymerase sigma factor [Rhizomicrobium sp.]